MSIWNQAYEDFRRPYYEEEKKAKKDYDGDGKVESGSKEHAGAVHNAIQRAKGGKPDGKDTRKEEVETVDEKFSMAAKPEKRAMPRPTKKAENKKGMSMKSRAIKAVGTQRRQDKETGVSEEIATEGNMKQARKNVGASTCWDGYKAKGTKTKNGRQVPNCVKEDDQVDEQSSTSTMGNNVTDALPWNRNTKYTTQGKLRKPGENVHGKQTGRGLNTSTGSMGTKTENFEFSNAIHEAYEEDIKEFAMDEIGKAFSGAGAKVADIAANHPVATAAAAGGALGALTGGKKKVKKGLGTAAGAALGAAVGGVPGAVVGGLAGNVVS